MKCVDDFRLKLGDKEYVPLMIGGMGVDISTAELALEAARLGGIGHISDALVTDVSDRRFETTFVKDKTKEFKHNILNADKSSIKFKAGRHCRRAAPAYQGHHGSQTRGWTGIRQLHGKAHHECAQGHAANAPECGLGRWH